MNLNGKSFGPNDTGEILDKSKHYKYERDRDNLVTIAGIVIISVLLAMFFTAGMMSSDSDLLGKFFEFVKSLILIIIGYVFSRFPFKGDK
jgi:hypothetical protein